MGRLTTPSSTRGALWQITITKSFSRSAAGVAGLGIPMAAMDDADLASRCTRCVFGPRAVVQPRYVVGDVAVCRACATLCLAGIAEEIAGDIPLRPFACGVARLAATGLCADVFRDARAPADATPAPASFEAAVAAAASQQDPAGESASDGHIVRQLEGCVRTRDVYEDAALRGEIRALLPLKKFRVGAAARREARALEKQGDNFPAALAAAKAKMLLARSTGEADGGYPSDFFLEELVNFFKGPKFFRWFKKPDCAHCGNAKHHAMAFAGASSDVTDAERAGWAATVELYECKACGGVARFPRLNNPRSLLKTRTGRCGEFANAFTACAVACGFDARYVLDTTDHVWTEVYSAGRKRWVHVDSCEKKIDKPLLYETGWGKELVGMLQRPLLRDFDL